MKKLELVKKRKTYLPQVSEMIQVYKWKSVVQEDKDDFSPFHAKSMKPNPEE